MSEAQTTVQAIGPPAVHACLMRWFEPLQRGRTQRLSREGGLLLRSFVWLAQSLKDPELLESVGEICEVEFKPKSNGQKVIPTAAEATGKTDPTAKPPAALPSLDSLIVRALAAALSPGSSLIASELSGRIQIGTETVCVRGDLDTYEVRISTGAIFRVSDGKRVHISTVMSGPGAIALPDFAGITELFRQILILAEDAKHPAALTATSE